MRVLAAATLLSMVLAGCLQGGAEDLDEGVLPPGATPVPPWADPQAAAIRPGVPLQTENGPCPTSFVLARADNATVFVATTAWCVRGLSVGSLATIGGPERIAMLAYSSFATMEEIGEADPLAREYNDLALFLIDASSREHVSPALLAAQGPAGAADPGALRVGDRVVVASSEPGPNATLATRAATLTVRAPEPPSGRDALVTGRSGDWALQVHAAPPSLPGGMGSPVLTPDGRAVGVVVNLGVSSAPGANGVARLDAMLAYARDHAKLDLVLATA